MSLVNAILEEMKRVPIEEYHHEFVAEKSNLKRLTHDMLDFEVVIHWAGVYISCYIPEFVEYFEKEDRYSLGKKVDKLFRDYAREVHKDNNRIAAQEHQEDLKRQRKFARRIFPNCDLGKHILIINRPRSLGRILK